jgi:hypothetical protein
MTKPTMRLAAAMVGSDLEQFRSAASALKGTPSGVPRIRAQDIGFSAEGASLRAIRRRQKETVTSLKDLVGWWIW